MKRTASLPPPSKSDKRLLLVSGGIFLFTCLLIVLSLNGRNASSAALGQASIGTPLPAEVIAKLTELPNAPMLTGALADELRAIDQLVAACPDYSPERRDQMQKHINWLLAPATLPQYMIIALGGNTTGKLLFGMATYTVAEWGQHQNASSSCLLPIGKRINELLAANGEERFLAFDT